MVVTTQIQASPFIGSLSANSQPGLLLDVGSPATAAASLQVDSNTRELTLRDQNGLVHSSSRNASTAAQSPAATVRTYLAGSALAVPTTKLQIGTSLRWKFSLTKTAAGSATSVVDIAIGTAGTTADTARLSFTKPAGTAAADEALVEVIATVRSIGTTGVLVAEIKVDHNLATTGHMAQQTFVANVVSGSVDLTVANLIIGLCITTGAADAVTIQLVQAEAWN